MSGKKRTAGSGAMLDLWRPPQDAGEPIGCLATTYTFDPGLFDEQCLARFLGIESEPNREDLAFLLERESRLGSVYAGVLADYTMAGVEHSLRWDVLPVRIRAGKQHAKLSLLVWSRHVRVIVASANLSEPGYRTNYEVAGAVDLTPQAAALTILQEAIDFLRGLLVLVPGADARPRVIQRAEAFLDQVEKRTGGWKAPGRRSAVHQNLVCTMPPVGSGSGARSSLDEAVGACRKRGGSPDEVWAASPFFDLEAESSRVVAALCKLMARGSKRELWFCVPAIRNNDGRAVPRLAAPKALLTTPPAYQGNVHIEMLPDHDGDKNRRPWHAKMLALATGQYSALMIGSSNLTVAGMGVANYPRNAEANLLTVVDRVAYSREITALESVWPEMDEVIDSAAAEWLGARPEDDEENQETPRLPEGFLSATYRAGEVRRIVLGLAPEQLPPDWQILACARPSQELLTAAAWRASGGQAVAELAWSQPQPPDKLEVRWGEQSAFMPLNVEDGRALPRPAQLDDMSADDMLQILAATDPSAAFRTWARRQKMPEGFDGDLDSATPIDLDPLRRYNLQETFLHRIRNRARVFAQLRANLQRPVWGSQALEWRLRGLVGIEPLAELYLRDFLGAGPRADEALLTLADFLIMLREVEYQAAEGMLPKTEFGKTYQAFLSELAVKLREQVETRRALVSADMSRFWDRVVERCVS